jgi:Zn-dependent protease
LVGFFQPSWLSPSLNFNGFTILSAVIQIFFLNLALAFFNLIPIHPLDGGKIMFGLLPQPYADKFDAFLARYGFMLLLLLYFTGFYKVLVFYPASIIAEWLL